MPSVNGIPFVRLLECSLCGNSGSKQSPTFYHYHARILHIDLGGFPPMSQRVIALSFLR